MGDPQKIVECKRRHLEDRLKKIALEFGMDSQEQKSFLDYWCSPGVRNSSEIRAEQDEYFNIRMRAQNWMERRKGGAEQKPESRVEQYAKTSQKFKSLVDEYFGNNPGAADGAPDNPDEQ